MHEDILVAASRLSDDELHERLKLLAHRERDATVEIVAHLAVMLDRKKHRGQGWASVYSWCCDVLHLSRDAAYNRVAAARVARRFPAVLEHLAAGFVNLTTVKILRPVLTAKNHRAILAEAKFRTRQECELIVARLQPRPDVPSTIRPFPAAPVPGPAPSVAGAPAIEGSGTATGPLPTVAPAPPDPRPVVEPLAPKRYRLEMTMDEEAHDALRQLQDLLAREVPSGDPAAIVKAALVAYVHEVEKKKRAATDRPRPPQSTQEGSRDIPAHVARAVWERDGNRCAFVGTVGRCKETRYLELHHRRPYGHQGPPTVENISIRCRTHNVYESELTYGPFRNPSAVREQGEKYVVSRETRAVPGRRIRSVQTGMALWSRDEGETG
jgi:hypothetical protein